ncbi:MAG TPA: alcohol dehydrogenase catalytic domain-containing protein, partial [Candidatus Thermoplasmatota archaeon]|nr:alcohol dehydrogenase catalytic domain-containing protein [Candidatus Thermoplasmatota archaeon]
MTSTRSATSGAAREARRVVLRRGEKRPTLASAPPARRLEGGALVRSLLVGIDGTDEEVLRDPSAAFPPGRDEVVLGHECLGEVVEAPEGSGLERGDRVVPLVRHGCGLCAACAGGEADMCGTGRYREHGIKGLDGFMRDAWSDEPDTLVKVPDALGDEAALTEPLSIALKAIEVVERIQRRVPGHEGLRERRVLLAGTGSLGILAAFELAFLGAQVWAYDLVEASRAAGRAPRGRARAAARRRRARGGGFRRRRRGHRQPEGRLRVGAHAAGERRGLPSRSASGEAGHPDRGGRRDARARAQEPVHRRQRQQQ